MAVREASVNRLVSNSRAYWLAALVAAGLSLAAALVGLSAPESTPTPSPPVLSPLQELEARNRRIAFFEARVEGDPIDYTGLNILASDYLQRVRETGDVGDYERAEVAAERSLQIVPLDNYAGKTALATVKLAQHDFRGALTLSTEASQLRPDLPAAHGLRGDAQLAMGLNHEAHGSYEAMVQRAPGLSSLSRLASMRFLLGDVANAKDLWRQATELSRTNTIENQAWAQTELAVLHFNQGNLKQAEDGFASALALYPDYVHALAGLAALRAAAGRLDEAAQYLETAQERQPVPQHMMLLTEVYLKAGRQADAEGQINLIEAIDRLYRVNGVNTDLPLAVFYADHARELERARELATNAYNAAPGIYAADALAWVLHASGGPAEALPYALESLRLGTPDAMLHYHTGLIYRALGKDQEAQEHLRKALDLNPHFSLLHSEQASQILAELEIGR